MISVPIESAETSPALSEPVRHWTITTTSGHTLTGYLPSWAEQDPSEEKVPIDHLAARLEDIHHFTDFGGPTLKLRRSGVGEGEPFGEPVLFGSIACIPYAEEPDPRIPTVSFNITTDCWIDHLDPKGVVDLADKLRAQADHLTHEVLPALVAARADWEAHVGPVKEERAQ